MSTAASATGRSPFLGFYSAKDAWLEEGWLRVRFEKPEAAER